MENFVITVAGGLTVLVLAKLLGLSGGSKFHVVTHGATKVKKTGKWMMVVGALMIIGGLALAGYQINSSDPLSLYQYMGYTITGYGLLIHIVGRVVSWFQSYK